MERERRTMPPDVGRSLLDARLRAGLRLREAASIVGISHSHLFRLEACMRVPSLTVAIMLADALALSDAERERLLAVAVPNAGRDWPGRRTARWERRHAPPDGMSRFGRR
ncbi:helix-turn-helix domain-containing protein [Streptomyces sp. NPDC008196]|uniref:helix-turn-helix domain-containing protein n=1 Tax=Streptomyces sp. NPDC008196 TaxID=3364819 RepID=UPI0036E369F5